MFRPLPFHPDRPGLVAPVRVDPSGCAGPTPGEARGPHWRASSRGWHVPTWVDGSRTGQRILEGVPILTQPGGVTGWAALHWCGARWFDGLARDGVTELDVPLLTTAFRRRQPGFAITQEHLRHDEVELVDGLPVTIPVRSLCFEVRHAATLWQAVVALDMAAYSDLVSLAEAAAYIEAIGPWTGVPQARKAIALADENAWSPQEVTMRRAWTLVAGMPRPLCNVPVFDLAGRHVGTPDLFDPAAGVAGEYEGSVHLAGSQRAHDVGREAEFRDLGIEVVTMLAADHPDLARFVTRLRAAYERASGPAGLRRRWTTQLPDWWVPTMTVAQRRALDPWQRNRLLRYRGPA